MTQDKNYCYDLIIVGAGAAGLIAGIFAGKKNLNVLLLEKMQSPGKKLLLTGGGRCNITNNASEDDFYKAFGKYGRFTAPAFKFFGNELVKKFFSELSVSLYSPDGFHIFPRSNSAQDIVNVLISECQKQSVCILTSSPATELLISKNTIFGVKTSNAIFNCKNLILATGGMSYPQTGSDGDGYKLAKFAGHNIVRTLPALVELYCKEKWISELAGVSLEDVEITVANKRAIRQRGKFLFTHEGISGPVVLDISGEVSELLDKSGEIILLLNFLPKFTQKELIAKIAESRQKAGKKGVLSFLSNLMPRSLAEIICKNSKIANLELSQLDLYRQNLLLQNLFAMPVKIYDTAGFKKAMLTKGGISLKEVDPKTLESKIVRGLFFAGEILDLQGKCGGYNLQWAFSSARLAVESLHL